MNSLRFYVITNGNENRMKLTEDAYSTYKLNMEWVRIPKHPTNGRIGCFESHIQVLRYAKQKDLDYICVAEDNVITTNQTIRTRVQHSVMKFIQHHPDWKLFLLGGFYHPFNILKQTSYPYIYTTHSIHGAQCYVIHRRLYNAVLDTYQAHLHRHYDAYLVEQAVGQTYILSPLLFYRNPTLSTTNTYWSNYLINFYYKCAYSKPIRDTFETYAIHGDSILILASLLIISLVLYVRVLRS